MAGPLTFRRCTIAVALYAIFAVAVLCVAPFVGSVSIDAGRAMSEISLDRAEWSIDTRILIDQRLARVLLGFLVGGALALVGSVFQVIFRNPLAAPSTLGITAGGAVGAAIAICVSGLNIRLGPFSSVQLFALAGSIAALGLIYLVARRSNGLSMHTLLLAGVTVGIFCGALILLIQYLADPHRLMMMDRWMMGGLDVVGYRQLAGLLPLLLPGAGLLFMQMSALNHLSLGEEMALGHGVEVAGVQKCSFLGGALTIAAAVSLAGPITFVGLIVPHIVRRISGYDHRIVLPGSFLAGGALLVACDTIARTLLAPTEMPVGIITALVGGPFFIYLLLKKA